MIIKIFRSNINATKKCSLFYLLLLLFIPSLLFAASTPKAKSTTAKRYTISQDYVDTSIQRAFYVLNEATSIAGVGFKQKQAIDEAKSIARQLRQKAQNDPNEKYILWKVSELEAQIYLEEKDILLMQKQQGQISINQLVARYNAEVGKFRPDFASMRRMHVQMGSLDNVKANQLADSYNKRYRSVSNEVIMSIENAIDAGDLDKAREELGYCLRNASYLSISSSKYSNLESQVEKLATARNEKPLIESETSIALAALEKNDLSTARENLSRAESRYNSIKRYLPAHELTSLVSNINKGNRVLPFKEDSLVRLNLSILSENGVDAADDFLKNILRRYGVSREKTAFVDKAILGVNSPENTQIHDEISSISSTDQDEQQPTVLDDIMARAKSIAQEKTDSLRRIEEVAARIAMAEQQRLDSIEAARRAAELVIYQKKQSQAQNVSLEIYSFLEKYQIPSAKQQFSKQRQLLLEYLDKESFYILETTLIQFAVPPSPPPSRPAPVQVAINSAPPATPPAVQKKRTSDPLPDAIQDKLQKNQKRAEEEIVQIYALLEKNQINDAYARFQKIQKPLKMFLQNDIYSMLETTISQAWEYQRSVQRNR